MSRKRFNRFLSHLMRYAWEVKKGNTKITFQKALQYAWMVTKEEMNNTTLPLITGQWSL